MSAPATAATALPVASPVTRSSAALSRSEEHTSELQSQSNLVCRLLLEKKNTSQSDKTTVQDLVGENRQQRRSAGEKHRENIERDRAKKHLLAQNKAQAFVESLQRIALS